MTRNTGLPMDAEERKAHAGLHDTRFDIIRAPWRRRALVLVTLATILATVALAIFGETLLSTLLAITGLGLIWMLRRVVRYMADLPANLVDERMEQTRNRAHKQAYLTYGGLVTLTGLVGELASRLLDQPLSLTQGHVGAFWWAAMLLWFSLPSMILAWTESEI